MPTSTLIILAVFFVIVLVLTVAYVLLRQREQQLVKQLTDAQAKMSDTGFLEQRLRDIEQRALQKEQEMLAQAQTEATKVLSDAQGEANEVAVTAQHGAEQVASQAQAQAAAFIADAQTQSKQLVDQAAAQLTGFQQQLQQDQQQKLDPAYETAAKGLTDIPQLVSGKTDKLLEDVHTQMMAEFEKRQKDFDTRLDTEWQQVRTEISQYRDSAKKEVTDYKLQQQQKVDQHIGDLIGSTLRQTLSIALTPKDQQRIVFEALERAKEQHAFDEAAQ
jgi:F0F1-type ATP synthase membrane subunit b/b'